MRRGLRSCSHISLVMRSNDEYVAYAPGSPGPRGKPESLGHVGARIAAEWNASGSPHSGTSPAKQPIPASKLARRSESSVVRPPQTRIPNGNQWDKEWDNGPRAKARRDMISLNKALICRPFV